MADENPSARMNGRSAISSSPSAMLALGAIGLMAGTNTAAAQEHERGLGGVTVTDTVINDSYARSEIQSAKSTAPLLDTPQTVNVIPQELIRDRAARTLSEVLRNTPGISFNAGEAGFGTSNDNFSLRGFDTSGSVFVDNARDSGSYARDVFNIASVEVVKGTDTANGRANAGGIININTKKPLLDNFVAGDISFGFDQYDSKARKRASFDINQQIGTTSAIRLNAVVEDSGIAGRNIARNKLWGVAPSIALGLGTDLRLILSWEHVERNDTPDWGVPAATLSGLFRSNSAAFGAPRDAFYGLASDFDRVTSDAIFGRIEYEPIAGFVLSNQTRWARVDRFARFTTPNSALVLPTVVTGTNYYDRVNTSLTNLTSLNAEFETGGIRHSVAAGVELSWEKSDALRYPTIAGSTDLFNPNPNRVSGRNLPPTEIAVADIQTFAVYLYDTISFGEQFQITGGVRGEGYRVELTSEAASGAAQGWYDGFTQSPFTWGGKIGLTWKPVENASIYASFGTGALPPGSFLSNPDISREGANAFPGLVDGAVPVRSRNYEIGAKVDLMNGGLSLALAGFRGEKRNVPIVGRFDTTSVARLQGYQKLIAQGVEFSASGQITPDWNIFGGLLVMKSERQISAELSQSLNFANPGDYSVEFPASGLDGDRLSFTPNVQATLWTNYRLPFGLTVGAGLQHVGSSFLGRPDDALRIIPNGIFGKLPAYTLVNAMISYDLTENIDIRLNVDNIANEKYAITTNWNGQRASLGAPRTYLISAGFRF